MLCIIFFYPQGNCWKWGFEKESQKGKSDKGKGGKDQRLCDGLCLAHWFSETLPCSACNDISLPGWKSFWSTELKWEKPEPLLTGNANWRPCEPGETILGTRKLSRRYSNWKFISKIKTGSDPTLWNSSYCSSTWAVQWSGTVKGACQLASRRKTAPFWENCYIACNLPEALWHRWKGRQR